MQLQPHQQRVVEEKQALDVKVAALLAFSSSPMWQQVPVEERDLLTNQFQAMLDYSNALGARISLWG